MSNSLRPHELQHTRPPCPSPTPGVHSDSRPLSRWCHPAISSSVVPFSSRPHSLPASESFPMSQLFESGAQSIGVSASTSVLPMNTQDWSPLGWTGRISLQSKRLSRVFSNTTLLWTFRFFVSFQLTCPSRILCFTSYNLPPSNLYAYILNTNIYQKLNLKKWNHLFPHTSFPVTCLKSGHFLQLFPFTFYC